MCEYKKPKPKVTYLDLLNPRALTTTEQEAINNMVDGLIEVKQKYLPKEE